MKKISRVFQALFRWILIFFIAFVWMRYFIPSLWLATVIAAAIASAIYLVLAIFLRRKKSIISLKQCQREEAENAFLSLSLDPKAIDFFFELASSKHNAEKKKNCIIIYHDEGEKVLLIPFLSHKNLSQDEIAGFVVLARKYGAKKVVVACGNADKECFSFAKNFDEEFVILNQYETYQKLFLPYNMLPKISVKYKKEKALAFKELAIFSLNKSRAKGYFLSALVLCISTIFVRAKIYYCVVASVLILLAIVSLFNPFERNATTKEIL